MTLTWEALEPLLALDAPPEPVIAALRGTTARERKALADRVVARLAETDFSYADGHRQALTVAAFGVLDSAGSLVKAVRYCWFAGGDVELLVDVLDARRPPWLPRLIPTFSRANGFFPSWRLTRALVRRGLIARPEDAGYILGAVQSATNHDRRPHNPADALAADPELISDVAWAWFRTAEAGNHLSTYDKWAVGRVQPYAGTWADALVGEVRAGRMDRARILDETLRRLAGDFRDVDLKWFVEFHGQLAPSLDEAAARADAYLRLLTVGYSLAVATGLAAARRLHAAGRLDVPSFLRAVPTTLVRKEKKAPLEALRLLSQLAAEPSHRDPVLACAAEAFAHRDASVQEAAWKVIEPHARSASAATGRQIRRAAAATAPSVAARLATLIELDPDAEAPESPPPQPAGPHEVPPFPEPIDGLEELAREFTALLDGGSDPIALERVLEASARYGSRPVEELRPWLARLAARHDWQAMIDLNEMPYSASRDAPLSLRFWLAELLGTLVDRTRPPLDWLPGDAAEEIRRLADYQLGPTPYGLLILRIHELAISILYGQAQPLLATPTHLDGTIDEATYERRLADYASAGTQPAPVDAAQARLRVRSGTCRLSAETFWSEAAWNPLTVMVGGALESRRYYLTELRDARPTSEDSTLLEALAGPYAQGRSAVIHTFTKSCYAFADLEAVQQNLWTWLAPAEPDLALAHWLPKFNRDADRHTAGPGVTPALEWLAITDRYDGRLVPVCLTLALASSRADTRLLAADLVATALSDGRLPARVLAEAVHELATDGLLKVRRLAGSLALISENRADAAWGLITELLPPLLRDRPRDTAALLTVVCDVAARIGASGPLDGLVAATQLPTATKVRAEARRLAALLDRSTQIPEMG